MIPFGHSGLCRGAPCFQRIPALPEKVGLERLRDLIRAETGQVICIECNDRSLHAHTISPATAQGLDALSGMPVNVSVGAKPPDRFYIDAWALKERREPTEDLRIFYRKPTDLGPI